MAGHGSPPAFDRGSDPRRQVGRQTVPLDPYGTPRRIQMMELVANSPLPLSLDEREEADLDWAHEGAAKAYTKRYHHAVSPPHERLG